MENQIITTASVPQSLILYQRARQRTYTTSVIQDRHSSDPFNNMVLVVWPRGRFIILVDEHGLIFCAFFLERDHSTAVNELLLHLACEYLYGGIVVDSARGYERLTKLSSRLI